MRKVKLKNKADFLMDLFREKENAVYFAHMRPTHIQDAIERRQIIIGEYGCLIWNIFKVNSPTYIGRKGDFQIKQIVVSTKAKGTGEAKALFRKAKRIAKDNGCPKIVLTVRKDNERAQGFYKKMGMCLIKNTIVRTRTLNMEIEYAEYSLGIVNNAAGFFVDDAK